MFGTPRTSGSPLAAATGSGRATASATVTAVAATAAVSRARRERGDDGSSGMIGLLRPEIGQGVSRTAAGQVPPAPSTLGSLYRHPRRTVLVQRRDRP